MTYEIQAGNRFFFDENARGGISTDGRVAGAIFPQGGIGVWGKHEPATHVADVAGSYRFALLMDSLTGPELQAFVGVCTLDGAGGVSFGSELANVEGTVIPTGTASGGYNLADRGRIEMELGSGLNLLGSMAYGGELLVFGGGIAPDHPPCILLMIRQGTGLTPDAFEGSYFAFGHEFRLDLPPLLQSSATFEGEVTADGAGIADLTYEERIVDGAPAPAASQLGTYTLAPDGELQVEWDFQTLRGAITGDGEVAILGGGTGDGDRPTLIVLIRKPE
ncbi:MAG: hypothetical protein QNJ98_11545 [Planctomycetota bacterium]|nr:hypothetical protein [Planctomycetota bacterium]